MHNAIIREKTPPLHMAIQIHNRMCFKSYVFLSQETTTRQIDRVCSEGSLNLMNTTVLKDNIEKKKRTLLREL